MGCPVRIESEGLLCISICYVLYQKYAVLYFCNCVVQEHWRSVGLNVYLFTVRQSRPLNITLNFSSILAGQYFLVSTYGWIWEAVTAVKSQGYSYYCCDNKEGLGLLTPSCCAFLGGSMSCFRASRKRHRPWISLHNHSDTAEIYTTLMRYFIYSIRVEESWSLEWFVWFHMLPTVTFHLQQNHLLSFTLLVY